MTKTTMPTIAYPAHLESDVVLRNGRTLRIRPVRPDDAEGLMRMFGNLSTVSLYSRFFDLRTAEEALRYSPVDVDYDRDFGVVGQVGEDIIAVAHYFAFPRRPNTAECAFTIADRYHGSLYAVNPNATEIDLIPCFPSVCSIEGPVDLAVIAVPAKHVEAVVDDCVAKGVRALVVITAGFGETGAAGREAELRIVEK